MKKTELGEVSTAIAPSTADGKLGTFFRTCGRQRHLLYLAAPAFLVVFVFTYLPMYGVVVSFQNFHFVRGVFGSPWVGLRWFESFFASPFAFRIIRNTFLLGFLNFAIGFPAPILLALLLNELRSAGFKRSIQTLSYFPSFISAVIIIGILKELAGLEGPVNALMDRLGMERLHFFALPEWFRSLYIGSDMWQSIGVGTIIYLAALTQLNPELYEASVIDGANRLQKIRHVTVPGILPTVIILMILNVGQMIRNADTEKVLLMYNAQTYETADIIGTYVYRQGILAANFSYAAAVGLLMSVVSFIFLYVTNLVIRRMSDTSLW